MLGAATPEARKNGANAFGWLLRAWSQQDTVSTFVSLFTPLELILQKCTVEGQEAWDEQTKAVENLIRQHGGDERNLLLEHFNTLKGSWSPSIQARFESIAREAEEAGLADWRADAEAFRKFRKIRNKLIHEGEGNVDLQVSIEKNDVQMLDDLVERYICFALFKNMDVYRSGWRGRSDDTGEDA